MGSESPSGARTASDSPSVSKIQVTMRKKMARGPRAETPEDRPPLLFRTGKIPSYPALYGPADEAQLRNDIQTFAKTLDETYKAQPQSARMIQFDRKFADIVEDAVRLRGLLGEGQPPIEVETIYLALGKVWEKPNTKTFFAISKGDKTTEVLQMNFPLGEERARKVSLQLRAGVLRAHAIRECFDGAKPKAKYHPFYAPWVSTFGTAKPYDQKSGSQAKQGQSLSAYLGKK